jgi:hypothetical protein
MSKRPLDFTDEESDSSSYVKTPRRDPTSPNTPTELDVSPEGSPGSPFYGWYKSYSTPKNNRDMTDKVFNSGPTVVVDRQNGNYLYIKKPYNDENKLTTAMFDEYYNQSNKFVYDKDGNEFYIDSYENHRGERVYHPVPKELKDTGEQLFGSGRRRRKSRKVKRLRKTKRRRRSTTMRRYR